MERHLPIPQVLDLWRHDTRRTGTDHPARSALVDLAGQTISAAERQEVVRHLAQCPACAHTLHDLRAPDTASSRHLRPA